LYQPPSSNNVAITGERKGIFLCQAFTRIGSVCQSGYNPVQVPLAYWKLTVAHGLFMDEAQISLHYGKQDNKPVDIHFAGCFL